MGYNCQTYYCQPSGFRRFVSKQEKLERLNAYKAELEQELQAVDERIASIDKE